MADLTARKDMISYSYGLISTPFKGAMQTEDQEIGVYLKAAQVWRLVSFFCLLGSFLLLLFSALELTSPSVRVIGANVFPNGFVENIGLLMEKKPA
jgi:type IV secretory pathway TrbF-like protein